MILKFMENVIWSDYYRLSRRSASYGPEFAKTVNVILRQGRDAGLGVLKKNVDLGDGWTKKVDDARKEALDYVIDSINPIEDAAYCDSDRNEKYWAQTGKSDAAKDFVKYIKKVKCK